VHGVVSMGFNCNKLFEQDGNEAGKQKLPLET
jgi:hypothetical protein